MVKRITLYKMPCGYEGNTTSLKMDGSCWKTGEEANIGRDSRGKENKLRSFFLARSEAELTLF